VNGQPALYDPKTEELTVITSPFEANQILACWPQRQLERIVGTTIEATAGIWSNSQFYFFLQDKELHVKMTIISPHIQWDEPRVHDFVPLMFEDGRLQVQHQPIPFQPRAVRRILA
jgi:hypothetical protein